MIIAKVYNNNVVAVTDDRREVILIGRGIGFQKKRGDSVDPEQIEKRFHLTAEASAAGIRGILVDVPYQIIVLTGNVTDYLQRVHGITLTDAVEIGLADHLDAAIKRLQSGINLYNDLIWETKATYRHEFRVALGVLDLLRKEGYALPLDEAGFIAMHLVNAGIGGDMNERLVMARALREVLAIVQREIPNVVDVDSSHFLRFLTHVKFVLQRMTERTLLSGQHGHLFATQRTSDPTSYACTQEIGEYLSDKFGIALSDEEQLYLMVHLARLRVPAEQQHDSVEKS